MARKRSGPLSHPSAATRADSVPAGDDGTYTTTFPATENPISEGGKWQRLAAGFTPVITASGNAQGTNGANDTYDDSYAYLTFDFGTDYEIEGVVHRGTPAGDNHEIELHLRMSDDADTDIVQSVEFLWNHAGAFQVTEWDGFFGEIYFTEISGTVLNGGNPGAPAHGDVLKARVVGSTMTAYVNGTPIWTGTCPFATGQPGIAFFKRPTGSNADFGLQSITVTPL